MGKNSHKRTLSLNIDIMYFAYFVLILSRPCGLVLGLSASAVWLAYRLAGSGNALAQRGCPGDR